MKKITFTVLVVLVVASLLTLVRFDAYKGLITFSDTNLSDVNTRVSVYKHESNSLTVNMRFVYDAYEFCLQRETCAQKTQVRRARHIIKTSIKTVELSQYPNCQGESSGNCVKLKKKTDGYDYNMMLVGNMRVPTETRVIELQLSSLRTCECEKPETKFSDASLTIKKIKRPLYKYFFDALVSA